MTSPEMKPDQSSPCPGLSVVIPVYNEEECVEDVCQEVCDSLANRLDIPWELVLVDDGSADRTPDLINDLSARGTGDGSIS